jgi:hypothetical protein
MSEENKDIQAQEVNEGQDEQVDAQELLKQKDSEIENLKKIAQGQDKKNSELFKKIGDLEKIISEKDTSKKTVEERLQEMQSQLEEREKRERAKEKESVVNRIIAEHKLDPEFDFDFLHKFETEDAIKENATKLAEYKKKLKDDGFKERAGGSIPIKGVTVEKDLSEMTYEELNKLASEKKEMMPAIEEAIKNKNRS